MVLWMSDRHRQKHPGPVVILAYVPTYFLQVLEVRKYEHQILFNAMQLDNADEQAAQVRRELDGRLHQVSTMHHLASGQFGLVGLSNFVKHSDTGI